MESAKELYETLWPEYEEAKKRIGRRYRREMVAYRKAKSLIRAGQPGWDEAQVAEAERRYKSLLETAESRRGERHAMLGLTLEEPFSTKFRSSEEFFAALAALPDEDRERWDVSMIEETELRKATSTLNDFLLYAERKEPEAYVAYATLLEEYPELLGFPEEPEEVEPEPEVFPEELKRIGEPVEPPPLVGEYALRQKYFRETYKPPLVGEYVFRELYIPEAGPIQIITPTGKTQDVELRPDNTIWLEDKQVGTLDIETGEIRSVEPPEPMELLPYTMKAQGWPYSIDIATDDTVWVGNRRVGTYNPETNLVTISVYDVDTKSTIEQTFTVKPFKVSPDDEIPLWAKLLDKALGVGETPWVGAIPFAGFIKAQFEKAMPYLKGIEMAMPYVEEYVEKPFAMTVLRPFYDEITDGVNIRAQAEFFTGMGPEGETRKQYSEWLGPEATLFFDSPFTGTQAKLGLKESVEILPWFLTGLPGGIRVVAGRSWTYLRYLRMNKYQRAGELLRQARAVKATKAEYFMVAPNESLLGRALRVDEPLKLVDDAYRIQGRALDQLEALQMLSMLDATRFGITGRLGRRLFTTTKEGFVKFNKHIRPVKVGARYHLLEVLENPSLVRLSPTGRHYLKGLKDSLDDIVTLLKQEGIPITEIAIGGAGQPEVYIPRYVLEKSGIVLDRAKGYLSGLGSLTPRTRVHTLAIEGIQEKSLKYVEDPLEILNLSWKAAIKRIATKRAADALKPLTKFTVTEASQARALVKTLELLVAGKRVPPSRLAAIRKQFPELAEQLEAAFRPKPGMPRVLGGEVTAGEMDALKLELTGLEEWLATEPARKLIALIKRTGWYKAEFTNLTLRQYTLLTGKKPLPNILTLDKKHVKWEYALDDAATELGYESGEALKYAVEATGESFARVTFLKAEIPRVAELLKQALLIEKPRVAADPEALKTILEQAKAIQAERTAIYAKALDIQEVAARELVQARKTVRTITRALKGLDVTESIGYDLAKALSKEQNAIITKVQQALLKERLPQRTALNKQLKTAQEALEKARLAFAKARGTRGAMVKAASQELGEAVVPKAGWGFRVFKNISTYDDAGKLIIITGQQAVDKIVKKFGERVSVFLRVPSGIAGTLRLFKASLDASPALIQLVAHSIRHPKAWGEAFTRGVWNYIDPVYTTRWLRKPDNFKAALEFAYHRGMLSEAEFTESAGMLTRLAKRIPYAGKYLGYFSELTFGRGNQVFTGTRTIGAINLWKGMRPWAAKAGKLDELALFLNRSTGFFSLRGMGMSKSWQAFLSAFPFFAPRFTFALNTFLFDIFRGGVRTKWALEHLGSMIIGTHLLYIAGCMASGQEIKLNPLPKSAGGDGADYGSFQIGDTKLSPLSGVWSLMRAYVLIATDIASGDMVRKLSQGEWESLGIVRTVRSRLSPLSSFFWDVLSGRDYIGEATTESWEGFGEYTGTRILPIWIEGVWDAQRKGERMGTLAAIAAMEFAGGRTYPEMIWDKVHGLQRFYIDAIPEDELMSYQRALIRRGIRVEWSDLNATQKKEIRRKYPDYAELEEQAKQESLEKWGSDIEKHLSVIAEETENERNQKYLVHAINYLDGEIELKDYLDVTRGWIRPWYSGAKAAWWRFREELDPKSIEALEKWIEEEGKPEDFALNAYWEISSSMIEAAYEEKREINWEAIRVEQRHYLYQSGLTPEITNYILEHEHDWLKDLPADVRQVEELIRDCQSILDAYYATEEGKARLEYREEDRETDARLVILYGYKPRDWRTEDEIVAILKKHNVDEAIVPQLAELRLAIDIERQVGKWVGNIALDDPTIFKAIKTGKLTEGQRMRMLKIYLRLYGQPKPGELDDWLRVEVPRLLD